MKNRIKQFFDSFNEAKNGPAKVEFIVAFVMVAIAAFGFCFMKDFRLTVTQSLNFNDCLFGGKLLRYYSEVNKLALSGYYGADWPQSLLAGANYSIINYATVGIFCLPVYVFDRLLGLSVPFLVYEFIVKLAFALMMVYMGKLVFDIAGLLQVEKKEAKWLSLCFLTSPVMLFSSVMISHLDIFSILFLLLGIKYMIKGNHGKELLFFMLSVSYKPFVILGIIPIVLLREKRILYIVRDMVVVVMGILVQNLVYHFDPGYGETQKFMSDTYDFVGRFFRTGYSFLRNSYKATASYFIIAFVIVCVLAYMLKKVTWREVFLYPFLVMGAFVLFVNWHPNWMILTVPYMILMLPYVFDIRLSCILECLFSFLIIIVSSFGWGGFYDIEIINGGILSQLLDMTANGKYDIAAVLTRKLPGIPEDIYGSLLCGVVAGIMIVYVLSCSKNRIVTDNVEKERKWERCAVWCRLLPVAGFMVYALLTCIKK